MTDFVDNREVCYWTAMACAGDKQSDAASFYDTEFRWRQTALAFGGHGVGALNPRSEGEGVVPLRAHGIRATLGRQYNGCKKGVFEYSF